MAANPEKGELDLTIGEKTYTLVVKTLALITWQKHFQTPEGRPSIETLFEALRNGSIEHAAVLFWAGLQKFHPSITYPQAMELMDELGGLPAAQDIITAFTQANTPDPDDVQELEDAGAARPQRARARRGTGDRLNSKPVVAA